MRTRNVLAQERFSKLAFRDLFRDRRLVIFLVASVLFHFANAAMLPVLGELLAKGKGRGSMMFMSACVITTQVVITLISIPTGRWAGLRGRLPLLLIGFGVLPVVQKNPDLCLGQRTGDYRPAQCS